MLIWIDLETTGLDPRQDKLLEIAVIITDDRLVEVARFEAVTDEITRADLSEVDPFVCEMHAKNGLWNESLTKGKSLKEVEDGMLKLLYEHCYRSADLEPYEPEYGHRWLRGSIDKARELSKIGPQLAGSTVSFDRSFLEVHMPVVAAYLHYRNLDVSSLNELAKRSNRGLFEGRPKDSADNKHRAMSDIESSLAVGRYYADYLTGIAM